MKKLQYLFLLLFINITYLDLYALNSASEKVVIIYDANGGIGEKKVAEYHKGSLVVLLSNVEGFSKEGAFLSGWSTSPNGTGVDYNLGDKIKLEVDLTLYAKWTNLSFGSKVTYMSKGSSTRTYLDPNTYANGTEATVLKNQFSFPNYAFVGYNTEPDGSGITYQPGDKFVITADITLYIKFIEGTVGPKSVAAKVIGDTKFVELVWEPILNTKSYKIYCNKQDSEDFVLITEITEGSSIILKDLNVNSSYRFAVSAVISGEETVKTISNRIKTGSSEVELLEMPVVNGYMNGQRSDIISDIPLEVSLSKAEGVDYFYTTNKAQPTVQSSKVTGKFVSILPPQSDNETVLELNIIAWNEKQGYSPVFTHTFSYKMPKPASDIAVGGYPVGSLPEFCNLSTLANGRIFYTTDGTNPSINSLQYKEPIPLSAVGITIIKAIAVRHGFESSEIAIYDFGPVFGGWDWADPNRFAINREDPRSVFYPYENEKSALQYHNLNPEQSSRYKSLDGADWRFKWVRKPFDRNDENGLISNGTNSFEMPDFNDSGWDDMIVPSCWTLVRDKNGKFKYDGPAYSAAGYIWNAAFLGNSGAGAPDSPYPPQTNQSTNASGEVLVDAGTNSVGTYRKTFTIDETWKDQLVFLNLTGVSSDCYIWVNGKPVGYAEDRWTNKEFDITSYLKSGENVLAVQVFRWSNGSWIEDQDMNRHAGIFRSIYFLSRPKVWIGDFEVHPYPTTEDNYNGGWNLDINVTLRKSMEETNNSEASRLFITLYDADGNKIGTVGGESLIPNFSLKENFLGNTFKAADLKFNFLVNRPKLWSAEKPYLYKLLLTLKNKDNVIESTCIRVGLREIKVVNNNTNDARVLLNGSRILLHGTNMHEIDPDNGYTVSKELVRKDLMLMKQNNINAIRMSHYPHHEFYYELCDEFGIYVMDEANLECHGSRETNVNPELQKMMQDRQRNMFERDKNHASVIFWSSGNENYEGPDVELHKIFRKNNTQWLRDRDLSKRPVHQSFDNGGADIFGTGYQYPSDLEKTIISLKTPMLQTEYCHNQGNSFGVPREYIEFFENQPKTMGGFIWDWVDQEIRTPVVADGKITGKYFLGFGKDWNDTKLGGWWEDPSQMSNMGCNGMVLTDRTLKPQVKEMKRQYQMINVGLAQKDLFYVNNKFLFTNVNEFDMEWELLENGRVIQKSKVPLHLDVVQAPVGVVNKTLTTKEFTFPFKRPQKLNPGSEYYFNVVFRVRNSTEWASSGFAISENQMLIVFGQDDSPQVPVPKGFLAVDSLTGRDILIKGKDFLLAIDKINGAINSYQARNTSGKLQEMINSGPVPNFFRSPVDGEREAVNLFRGTPTQAQMFLSWKDATSQRTTSALTVKNEDNVVVISFEGEIPVMGVAVNRPGSKYVEYHTSYSIYANGEIKVSFDYDFPELASDNSYVAEIGSILNIKGDFENLSWYGRGPGESYNNRKYGNDVGIWKSTVTEKAFMYPSNQETGNNVETRWFSLTDDSGFGLIVKGEPTIDFNATHFAPEELAKSFDTKFSPFISQLHPYQLAKSSDTYLRVIHKGTGVGGINSWGKTPLPQYRINVSNQSYSFKYSIKPISKLSDDKAINYWKTKYAAE